MVKIMCFNAHYSLDLFLIIRYIVTMFEIFAAIMAGTLYGLVIGIIPSAGATTGT